MAVRRRALEAPDLKREYPSSIVVVDLVKVGVAVHSGTRGNRHGGAKT